MYYSWAHLKDNGHSDFPELYTLRTIRGDRLKVEANRLRGMVRIVVEEFNGNRWQSVISNGVVIRELDLTTNRPVDLEQILAKHSLDLSSLPDNQILRLIGGNYGVMTEFLGKAERLFEIDPFVTLSLKEWWLKKWHSFKTFPSRFWQSLVPLLIYRPQLTDLVDVVWVSSLSSFIFHWNYSYLPSGALACAAALLCGLMDVFIRQRSPYLIKVLVLFLPGIIAIWLGWYYQ